MAIGKPVGEEVSLTATGSVTKILGPIDGWHFVGVLVPALLLDDWNSIENGQNAPPRGRSTRDAVSSPPRSFPWRSPGVGNKNPESYRWACFGGILAAVILLDDWKSPESL